MTKPSALPKTEFEKRMGKTVSLINENDLDGLIVFAAGGGGGGNIAYLTNHRPPYANYDPDPSGRISALIIPSSGPTTLISQVGIEKDRVFCLDNTRTGGDFLDNLKSTLRTSNLDKKTVGIVGLEVLPAVLWRELGKVSGSTSFVDSKHIMVSQRRLKSPIEIGLLREAARIGELSLAAGSDAALAGNSNLNVELAVRKAALEAGADYISYVCVTSGPSLGQNDSAKQEFNSGDVVFITIGGWFNGYAFNNSKVDFVGDLNEEQKGYASHLDEAGNWMIENMKAGSELRFVRTFSRERQILPYLHGIGLEVVEEPRIGLMDSLVLEPGLTLCIEPTINSREYGEMANKNTILITPDRVEILNQQR